MAVLFELALDELFPDLIGLPNSIKITFCVSLFQILAKDTIEKNKGRNALVGGAVNQDPLAFQSVHGATKQVEIMSLRRLEIHGEMQVGHAQSSDEGAFIGQCIVRGRKRQIDYGLITGCPNRCKLGGRWLARRANLVIDAAELIYFYQLILGLRVHV